MSTTDTAAGTDRKHPPLSGWGIAGVIAGLLLLGSAGVVLFFSDSSMFDSCTTVRESIPDKAKGDGTLTVSKEVTTCTPSSLSGGVPLIMAAVGGAFVAPGLLRLLPPGKYAAGGLEADTSQSSLATTARETAEQAQAQIGALNTTPESTPSGAAASPPQS